MAIISSFQLAYGNNSSQFEVMRIPDVPENTL
jgi:hypothetical protein